MTERPILFSGSMVRALLAGRKTQTRRWARGFEVRGPDSAGISDWYQHGRWVAAHRAGEESSATNLCPYGRAGDRLWVKEACFLGDDDCPRHQLGEDGPCWCRHPERVIYRADGEPPPGRRVEEFGWRPSIHCSRWASRITLDVVEIRAQRLQEITEADAVAEGVSPGLDAARDAYRALWDDLNGERAAWATNPCVWAVSFKVILPNNPGRVK
jgi:hypothetical protein